MELINTVLCRGSEENTPAYLPREMCKKYGLQRGVKLPMLVASASMLPEDARHGLKPDDEIFIVLPAAIGRKYDTGAEEERACPTS